MRKQYDVAYGSFLLVGGGVLASTLGGLFRIRVSEGSLAFFGIWFAVLGTVALLTAFRYSIILWRHFPLPLLSFLSLLFIGTLMLEDLLSPILVNAVSVFYGLTSATLCARWFFVLRPRSH